MHCFTIKLLKLINAVTTCCFYITYSDPDDYTRVSETFTIPAGTRRFDVPVEVIDDSLSEPDEEFAATLGC